MRISDWSSDVCSSDLKLCGLKEQLKIITLDGELEQLLVASVRADLTGAYPLDPALSQRILTALGEAARPLLADGTTFAVVTTPLVRRPLFQDRKSVGSGTSVSVRVDLGVRRIIKKKQNH